MTESKTSGDMLYGVGCDVINCKYHGHEDRCYANNISVEAPNATDKVETFCGTFAARADAK